MVFCSLYCASSDLLLLFLCTGLEDCGSLSLALRLRHPWFLSDYYFVILGALSLHAALLECLVFACDSSSILFSHTFWITILLLFWESCSYIRLYSQALSLHAALLAFLSARFRSRRLWLHRTIPLTVRCPQCRLLRLESYIQSSGFSFSCVCRSRLPLFTLVCCFRVWSAVSDVVAPSSPVLCECTSFPRSM